LDAGYLFKESDVLFEQICSASSDVQILSAIELFLFKQLNPKKIDSRLLAAMKLIYDDGITNVAAISEKINLSSASVRNLFREGIGRPPKEVISILRINKILKSNQHSYSSLTELGYQHGYFDQAHFIHDFYDILGMTPSYYFSNNELVFDFYNSGRWKGNIFEPTKSEK
jgi:AraC-like DNA-binding protein